MLVTETRNETILSGETVQQRVEMKHGRTTENIMGSTQEPHLWSASEASNLMMSGEVTVQQYISSLLRHIKEREPFVKAWACLDEDSALRQAMHLDHLSPAERGPLHGVAVGIKDIVAVKGMATCYGSDIHENDGPSPCDASIVSILRSAGAVILGKTATTEFAATSQGGPCRNPLNLKHTPGGSSSGSAAAVADCHVPIAIGTQTGGSMIRPGSFTGTFAFKPTWGSISTEGVGRFSITCDTLGFYTRNMDDLTLLWQLFCIDTRYAGVLRSLVARQTRVAFIESPMWHRAGIGTRKAWAAAEIILSEARVSTVHVDLPQQFTQAYAWRETIVAAEARAAFLSRFMQFEGKLHASIRKFIGSANHPTPQALCEAYDGLSQLRGRWDKIASGFDFILTPSVPDEAPLGLEYTGSSALCSLWTILHVPTLNVPGFTGKHGLPIGLTVTGPRYADKAVLEAGRFLDEMFTASRATE